LRSGRILDIGSGTTPFFLINTQYNEKFGIDPAGVFSVLYENITLLKTDLEEETTLQFENNFFEIIAMLAVFEHIEPSKLTDVLKETKRTLKPGGRFILTTSAPWSDKLLRIMAKLQLVSSGEINDHKCVYNHALIADCLYNSGFNRNKMNFGYFEFFLNIWAYADK
jgi:SAM-dependent methyltransferase